MASNFPQSELVENSEPNDSISDDNNSSTFTTSADNDQLEHLLLRQCSTCPDSSVGICTHVVKRPTAGNYGLYPQGQNPLSDPHLIRSRRVNFNPRARKNLELMCEDKVSKYKLEEVHCSLPSSVKSTFIMTFSPDGRKVASTHGDHRIYICDLNTGKLLDTLEGHPKTPWCLAWHSSNRDILASGCLAGEVRVWDLRSKACESWTSDNNTIITSLDFHPKERVLVIATANDIHFWDWSESEPFAKTTTTHDKEKVKFVEFDSSGTKLITGISNLPRYAGCSSDSLQNRIIDSYLNQGPLDQLSAENMTQNSEITSPLSGSLNSNELFNDRNSALNRLSIPGSTNNEQDLSYRSTLTLSRVSTLFRQLETLEDSMRHTSFSPYINPRSLTTSIESNDRDSTNTPQGNERDRRYSESSSTNQDGSVEHNNLSSIEQAQTAIRTDQQSTYNSQSNQPSRTSNAIEPFVVSFDECLEQLQLAPLIVNGRVVNLATVIEQYPINLPYQLHFVMQYDSMNQVNQNFIRISKLMSSVRLYRQVVSQILSSNAGQGHYQPNQILTAQSSFSRSSRQASNLPIIFRNFNSTGGAMDGSRLSRGVRTTDPILAIQFRNSARNVPLVTICKIDLLCARSVCITRSQYLIEQAIASSRSSPANDLSSSESNNQSSEIIRGNLNPSQSTSTQSATSNIGENPPFHHLLQQLHQSLTIINHAPLTTSNVNTHISSLRTLINKLLNTMSSMLHSEEEGRRIISLVHDIAHNLTGRSWSIPLGATLDDIRLDVIHTLCIVDLTLHLTRQIQYLQLQKLSALARIDVSGRSSNRTLGQSVIEENLIATTSTEEAPTHSTEVNFNEPSTSQSDGFSTSKRKDADTSSTDDDIAKRRKLELEAKISTEPNSDTEMIDKQPASSPSNATANPNNSNQSSNATAVNHSPNLSNSPQNMLPSDSLGSDRFLLWNSTAASTFEQSLQRFLVATASNMNNNHILVRIYHRSNGNPTVSSNTVLDQIASRSTPPPLESRRRALSQDNSGVQDNGNSSSSSSSSSSISSMNNENQRNRQVGGVTASSNGPVGASFDSTWQRHPHLHVYQTRGTNQHLWFNQWTIPLPISNCNFRLQCWNFSLSAIPNIKDSHMNLVTQKCRIHTDASIDISSDGGMIACLVPRDDSGCLPNFDLKVFSLKSYDFGTCYHQLPYGPNAISVSMSPTAEYAVVGLASHKFISSDPNDDDLTIAKVSKLKGKHCSGQYVRDIKIKRDDSSLSLNAIRWLPRGIVYNVGPQHHQRYQATRVRNRIV